MSLTWRSAHANAVYLYLKGWLLTQQLLPSLISIICLYYGPLLS